MEFVYLIILLISLLLKDIETALLKKVHVKSFEHEKILFVSDERSLLQCAQRCRFIEKNAIVDFKNSKCTCLKYESKEGQEHQGTFTGVFVNQKLMKAKTTEPPTTTKLPETTKPPRTKVINVALNKYADQSSRGWSFYAYLAIDGSTSTLSSTLSEFQPWWTVDLEKDTDIVNFCINADVKHNEALIVETRKDRSNEWNQCKNIGDLTYSPFYFKCDKSTKARYVKIRSTTKCKIDMYEFEVRGRVAV